MQALPSALQPPDPCTHSSPQGGQTFFSLKHFYSFQPGNITISEDGRGGEKKGAIGLGRVRGLRSELEEAQQGKLSPRPFSSPPPLLRAGLWVGRRSPQGHFRSTHCFPPSSYSCLEIHICWKVPWVRETVTVRQALEEWGKVPPHIPPVQAQPLEILFLFPPPILRPTSLRQYPPQP